MIKAFIFDVDGTLVDTGQLHIDAWRAAFHEFGVEVPVDRIQSQLGRKSVAIAEALLPEERRSDTARVVEEKWRIFREYFPRVKGMPKTKDLFKLLREKGFELGLATSTTLRDAEFYINLLSIKEFIGALVTAEDIQHSKPHPEIFLKAAARLDVDPKESVVVGDSPHDMEAAASAGMVAVGVLTGGFSREVLEVAGASITYCDIEDLYKHIEDIIQ